METLIKKSSAATAECPLRHPGTANPLACANCIGHESPAQKMIADRHWAAGLLQVSLFRAIYDCAWGTVHWNSPYIAPNSKPWKQAPLEGTMPLHFRISYFTMATVISVLATFVYGAAIARSRPDMDFWQGGFAMLLIAGPGWVLQAMLALTVKGKQSLDYLSHMTTIMWKGTMPLALLAAIVLIVGPLSPIYFAIAVGFSSLMMARAHYLRVHSLGLSQSWTLTWFLLLQISAWGMIGAFSYVQLILNWQ
jgi:hypothetical protein